MRFNNNNFRSLNESINYVQNPQWALDEALEYTAALEEVILSICEELEIDPDELVEDVMTQNRAAEHFKRLKKADARVAYTRDGERRGSTPKTHASAHKKRDRLIKQFSKELRDTKYVYGKGGKRTKLIQRPKNR